METIRGRKSLELDLYGFRDRLANYSHVLLDLGTGDGRYVRTLADRHSDWFVIGMDSCRENLREDTWAKLPNMLFIIASAQNLPYELNGLVSHIAINFPWGSLLDSLLTGDSKLMRGLDFMSHSPTAIELCLNAGAMTEAGTTLEKGAEQVCTHLLRAGWTPRAPLTMNAQALRSLPSTWAKRLAFGRDPRAIAIQGSFDKSL